MRYNLDSTLPINAFSPRGGLFAYGMTLEGGGGGGILKPVTNVLGGAAKAITGGVKAVTQPIYNATLRNIPGVDNALVGLDKAVGKSIPGGWGTVASVAASFIPGAQFMPGGYLSALSKTGLATGLGALAGSGVMRGKNEFNLQGAIMGGAMAYGASQLSAGLQEAGSATSAIEEAAKRASAAPGDSMTNFISDQMLTGADAVAANTPAMSTDFAYAPSGEMVPSNIPSDITGAVQAATPTPTGLDNLIQAGKGTISNIADAGTGIKNLAGFGADGSAAAARSAFAAPITNVGLTGLVMGGAGLAALEEQQKYLDEQAASGAMGNAEYAAAKAKIDAQIATARATVAANPLQTSTDTGGVSEGPSLYSKNYGGFDTLYDKEPSGGTTLYAMGGAVNPPDDQTYLPNQTPMQRLETSGLMSMIGNTAPQQMYARGGEVQHYFGGGMLQAIANNPEFMAKITAAADKASGKDVGIAAVKNNPLQTSANLGNLSSFTNTPLNTTLYANNPKNDFYDLDRNDKRTNYATGGMPRFLSGGGDGMSDSIKASINGSQEARLADGEFVVPADVVSHIGNGSSKAGAKQLYSMMDRVRQARVGTKKQGKQINPRKYLAA